MIVSRTHTWILVGLATAVLIFAGCGSDNDDATSAAAGLAEDVLIWGGEPDGAEITGVATSEDLVPKAQLIGITLKTTGHFYTQSTPLSEVTTHSFATKQGVAYQVQIIGARWGDDPHLYLSRNPEPGSFMWKSSTRTTPLMDGIVFKSTQDGTMYAGVLGAATTTLGGGVQYLIQVRKCSFGEFTQ